MTSSTRSSYASRERKVPSSLATPAGRNVGSSSSRCGRRRRLRKWPCPRRRARLFSRLTARTSSPGDALRSRGWSTSGDLGGAIDLLRVFSRTRRLPAGHGKAIRARALHHELGNEELLRATHRSESVTTRPSFVIRIFSRPEMRRISTPFAGARSSETSEATMSATASRALVRRRGRTSRIGDELEAIADRGQQPPRAAGAVAEAEEGDAGLVPRDHLAERGRGRRAHVRLAVRGGSRRSAARARSGASPSMAAGGLEARPGCSSTNRRSGVRRAIE